MQKKIHFIGIGGIGISGLARYLMAQGAQVSGSDIAESSAIKALKAQGVPITIPHSADSITSQDLVIHSAIIKPDNVEIMRAKALGIPVLSRSLALELILKGKRVFSVCGAHGKSTTSAILSSIFPEYGAIIGADSKEFGSNVRACASDNLIFEADESDKSFLNSNPYYAIVPNAEPEHMETYNHSLEEFYGAYGQFLGLATKRVINVQDSYLQSINLPATRLNPQRDICNIEYVLESSQPYTRFTLRGVGRFQVYGFGEHIALNASLAILCARSEGKDSAEIARNLLNFKGIKKRFDILQKGATTIIDDYAHHPTEILATLKSARTYAELSGMEHTIAIWQPHKYSRLVENLQGFRECFHLCDELVILPVWRAGEEEVPVDLRVEFAHYQPTFATHLKRESQHIALYDGTQRLRTLQDALIIGLGAGDITYQLRGEK